jgi:hypothetical protein
VLGNSTTKIYYELGVSLIPFQQEQNDGVTTQKHAQISLKHFEGMSRGFRVVVCSQNAWFLTPWCLGVPFIGLKGLGAIGASFGSYQPSSVHGCTRHCWFPDLGAPDSPVTHLTVGATDVVDVGVDHLVY